MRLRLKRTREVILRPVTPRLSIIIPCRNDAVALAATLDDLSRLRRRDAVEVIVAAAGDEEQTRQAAAVARRLDPC